MVFVLFALYFTVTDSTYIQFSPPASHNGQNSERPRLTEIDRRMIPDRYQQYISPEDIPVSRNQESKWSTQFQFVQDWIHKSTPALPPDMAYGEAWMNHNKDDPEAQNLAAKCRSAPSWELFQAMYEIAVRPRKVKKISEWPGWCLEGKPKFGEPLNQHTPFL